MFPSMIFSMTSIICGLAAVLLPVISLIRRKFVPMLVCFSLWACSISLFSQICEYHYRTQLGDFSALMDTSSVILACAGILLAAVAALNIGAFLAARKRSAI